MPMRLSEVHPAVVHFPLALLPVAVAADAIGRSTNHRELLAVGKWSIAGAAVSAAIAGVFGLIAQEEVDIRGDAVGVLQTHRTLNVAALGVVTAMAFVRATRKKPSVGYLLVGLGVSAAVSFSAYLGGKLVYRHGVGVERAGGIRGEDPMLTVRNAGRVAATAARDLGRGVAHAARDLVDGHVVPVVQRRV